LDELSDIYDAEHQLLKALPKMAKAAESPELKEAFEGHLDETKGQVARLEKVFQSVDQAAKRKKCKVMQGLVGEGEEILKDYKGTVAIDAALIAAARKVEHYEIATYGTLARWAEMMNHEEALSALQATLAEEKGADEKLSEIANATANLEAQEA
jgi:ferritin-like metal-binding protein YciE